MSTSPSISEILSSGRELLEANIKVMETAADDVRDERGFKSIARFYHMVALECAELMAAEQFARCVEVAREQMRRPA